MDVFAPHLCVQRPEENIKFFGTGVRDASELPRECWEVNLDPLPEQPMLSSAEPPAASHLDFQVVQCFQTVLQCMLAVLTLDLHIVIRGWQRQTLYTVRTSVGMAGVPWN